MTEDADTSKTANAGEAAREGAWTQSRMILRAIFTSPVGRRAIVLIAGLVVAILVTSFAPLKKDLHMLPYSRGRTKLISRLLKLFYRR